MVKAANASGRGRTNAPQRLRSRTHVPAPATPEKLQQIQQIPRGGTHEGPRVEKLQQIQHFQRGGYAQGVWFLAVCRGPDRRHFNHFNGCGFAHGAFERRNFCIFCGRAYAHQDLPGEAKGTRDGTGWHFSATSTRRGVLVNDSAALCVHSLRIASWSEWHARSCLKTCCKEESAKALPERWIAPTALRCLLG